MNLVLIGYCNFLCEMLMWIDVKYINSLDRFNKIKLFLTLECMRRFFLVFFVFASEKFWFKFPTWLWNEFALNHDYESYHYYTQKVIIFVF